MKPIIIVALTCGTVGISHAQQGQFGPDGRLPYWQRLANCEAPENYQKMVEIAQQFHEPKPTYESLIKWCKANTAP